MASYSGSAKIVQEDLAMDVECSLNVVREPSGLISWSGSFDGADLAHEPETGPADLCLPDGRSAKILVNRQWLGTGSGEFLGNGPPPE